MSDGVSWHDFVAVERRRSCVQGKVPPPERFAVLGSPFAVKPKRMTIDQIRRAYDAQPFVPFVLILADGREVVVRGREFMLPSPSGRTIAVYETDDAWGFIDVRFVTELRFRNAARKRRRA